MMFNNVVGQLNVFAANHFEDVRSYDLTSCAIKNLRCDSENGSIRTIYNFMCVVM